MYVDIVYFYFHFGKLEIDLAYTLVSHGNGLWSLTEHKQDNKSLPAVVLGGRETHRV